MSRRQSAPDERVKKLENELADSVSHTNQLKANLNASELTLKNIEKQLESANSQLGKTKESLKSLEKDNDDLRKEKNKAIEDRDDFLHVKDKQDAEIERLKTDITDLTAQLKKAIDGKCEALSKSDEILSKASQLEQKERRLEKEKVLLDNQVQNLTHDVNKYLLEIQNMNSAHTSKVLTLETELISKTEELSAANNKIIKLSEANANLVSDNNELRSNTLTNSDTENDMIFNYKRELEAKTKLSEMYSTMASEANNKYEELNNHVKELQMLKNTLTEQKNNLDTENNTMKMNYESALRENDKTISSLKAELESVTSQVKASKEENLKAFLEDITPSAAATCNLIKYKSLTQIYDEIVKLCDELNDIKKENARLTQVVSVLEADVQEKSSKINQQMLDLNEALEKNKSIMIEHEQQTSEINKLRDDHNTTVSKVDQLEADNSTYKLDIADLSRQVCFLLQKIETLSPDSGSSSNDMEIECTSISKELVTFSNIQELQKNNITLLKLVKDLKSKLNHFKDCTESDENKPIIDMLNKRIDELTYSQNHQAKIMDALTSQCDRYKKLYNEAIQQKEPSKNIVVNNDENMNTSTSSIDTNKEASSEPKSKQDTLEIELADTKKRFAYQRDEYKKYRDEMLANEKILTEQLEDKRTKLNDLNAAYVRCASMSKTNAEKYEILQRNITIYKKQIVSLEERNKLYDSSIVKQEETIKYLRDEIMETITKLNKTEVQLENFKQECKFLKDSEIRLQKERDLLKKERYSQSLINNDIEYLKVTEQKKENEDKINLEIKLNMSNKQCTDLQKQIKLEQDKFNEMKINFERQLKHVETSLKESDKHLNEKKLQNELIQEQLDVKNVMIEDLNKRLINLITSTSYEGNIESTKKVRDLENQLQSRQKQFDALQQQLVQSKEATKEYANKHNALNEQLKKVESEFAEYKTTAETNLKNVYDSEKKLKDKAMKLESEIKLQSEDVNMMDSNDLKSELSRTRVILDNLSSELKEKRLNIDAANLEIERLSKAVKNAEDKYAHELSLHSKDVQTLKDHRLQLSNLSAQLNQIKQTKDQYESEISKLKTNLNSQEKELITDYQEMKSNITELRNQNSILHEQLQKYNFHKKLSEAERSDELNSSNNKITVDSNQEDNEKSEERLLLVIKYLKQDKNILDTKYESINAENSRMKSELDILQKQLMAMKNNLESDRRRSGVATPMVVENSEIINKTETLHALTDSNVMLRQERLNLQKQVKELSINSTRLDETIKTMTESNSDLTSKLDTLQTENTNLKSEISRWRTRVSALVEKSNKTGTEDWKRLQNERETLAKKLTAEKDVSKKFSDEILTLKMEKVKTDEQVSALNLNIKSLTEESNKQANELNIVKKDMSKVTQELLESKLALAEKIEANAKLTESLSKVETSLTKLNERDMQLRIMARKYKTQYETILKSQSTDSTESAKSSESPSKSDEQNAKDNKITELEEQIALANNKNTDLQKEIENIREHQNNEEKCKQELLATKSQLDEVNSNLAKELAAAKETINAITQNREECDNQLSTLKISYNEITKKFECEKSQLDKERRNEILQLNRRIEMLSQKIINMESDMSVSKPSTSSSHMEEAVTETLAVSPNVTGITTSDITSSLGSSQNIIENLPSSSSTVTQFPDINLLPPESTQDNDLDMVRDENEVSEDLGTIQSVNTVGQMIHQQTISSPTPRNEASSDANRETVQTHQQASSSSSTSNSNSTVTTSDVTDMELPQGSHKRSRQIVDQSVNKAKRLKMQQSDDPDLEYEVPSSSQRDQEDDCCVIGDSGDEDNQYQETSIDGDRKTDCVEVIESHTDVMDIDNNASVTCAATTDDNEVEVIENSSQVNQDSIERNEADTEQSERSGMPSTSQSPVRGPQIETISSVTEGRGSSSKFLTLGVVAGAMGSGSGGYDEGNDSIVPSTPILYVPRRNDGFGEAVSSPVTSGRVSSGEDCFTFGEILPGPSSGVMDDTHADLTLQIAPQVADTNNSPSDSISEDSSLKIDDGSETVPLAETSSVNDEEVPTVSSQGSHPGSPHQIDEGSEAEATTPVMRNTAVRSNWNRRPVHRAEYNTRAYSQRFQRGGRPNRRPQNQYKRN